jgi:hypothetical protein
MSVPALPRTAARKSELAHYIDPLSRQGDNHAAFSAFLLNPRDREKPDEAHLSVNATEVETIAQIAGTYREMFQSGTGEVAICTHKVRRYVDCGRKAGIQITNPSNAWVFQSSAGQLPAFRHRPGHAVPRKGIPANKSHCGVEFVRELNNLQERQFARRLAKKPKFHLVSA